MLRPAVLRDATHWDKVVTELGYPWLLRHSLRHTGLTWMADAGVPPHVLQKIAGHGSLTTTQLYRIPMCGRLKAQAKRSAPIWEPARAVVVPKWSPAS